MLRPIWWPSSKHSIPEGVTFAVAPDGDGAAMMSTAPNKLISAVQQMLIDSK